jgi:hypothetical protein
VTHDCGGQGIFRFVLRIWSSVSPWELMCLYCEGNARTDSNPSENYRPCLLISVERKQYSCYLTGALLVRLRFFSKVVCLEPFFQAFIGSAKKN